MRFLERTGRSLAAAGKSHSGLTPTTSSSRPMAKRISVALGSREAIRIQGPTRANAAMTLNASPGRRQDEERIGGEVALPCARLVRPEGVRLRGLPAVLVDELPGLPRDHAVLDRGPASVQGFDSLRVQRDRLLEAEGLPVALREDVERLVGARADREPVPAERRPARVDLDELHPEGVRARQDQGRAERPHRVQREVVEVLPEVSREGPHVDRDVVHEPVPLRLHADLVHEGVHVPDVPAPGRPDVLVHDEHLLRGLQEVPRGLHVAREDREVLRLQADRRGPAVHRLQRIIDLEEPALRAVEEGHAALAFHRHHATSRHASFGTASTSTPFPLPGSRSIAARTACSASRFPASRFSPWRKPCSITPYASGLPEPEAMKGSLVIAPRMSAVYTCGPSASTPATTSST